MKLIDFFEVTFNYEKLRKSRRKRGMSIAEVAKQAGIPAPTLQKYESGIIRKIPLEILKKLCAVYKTNYEYYYGWTSFPLFGTFTGIALSFLYGISLTGLFNGINLGFLLGAIGMNGAKKYFELHSEEENRVEILYSHLSSSEKKDYERFKKIINLHLNSEEYFTEEELKKEEIYLLSYFYGHKLKKEYNFFNKISPYNIDIIEVSDDGKIENLR